MNRPVVICLDPYPAVRLKDRTGVINLLQLNLVQSDTYIPEVIKSSAHVSLAEG